MRRPVPPGTPEDRHLLSPPPDRGPNRKGNFAPARRPVRLHEVLRGLRRSVPWGARLGWGEVWRLWDEAVGPTVARVARPCDASGGRLWVEVEGPAWLHELKLMEGAILKKLNSRLEGEPRLERIFFKLGWPSRRPRQVEPEPPPPPLGGPLPSEEEAHLGVVSDPVLREQLASFLSKALAREVIRP